VRSGFFVFTARLEGKSGGVLDPGGHYSYMLYIGKVVIDPIIIVKP
jgi:hypothetical protein